MKPLNLDILKTGEGGGHFLMGRGMAHVFFRSRAEAFLNSLQENAKKILLGLYLSNISFSLKKNCS